MSAQVVQIRPLPPQEKTDQLTYEEFQDFLRTIATFMAAGHRLGDAMRKRKMFLPATRVYGAIHIMGAAHDLITKEAIDTLKK